MTRSGSARIYHPLVKGLEDAGLEDWLISLHGMEQGHENTVVDHRGNGGGGWKRLTYRSEINKGQETKREHS